MSRQFQRMHFRTMRSVADWLASITCFKWLIGSMNECYIEINQDFTKVKITLSWCLDLCMTAIFCIMPLMDKYINIFSLPLMYILGDEQMRECIHPRKTFLISIVVKLSLLKNFNVKSFILCWNVRVLECKKNWDHKIWMIKYTFCQ